MKYANIYESTCDLRSHLLREMWIEIPKYGAGSTCTQSHLLREMWIEIMVFSVMLGVKPSHLLREMWIEIRSLMRFQAPMHESSPAGDVD